MVGSSQDATVRAILYAFIANFGIAIAKTWAAWLTGSGSMLAEAIHSYADTGNQVLLYLGLKQSQRPPDEEHPLGYGKLSYFWSFIVAMLLFSMGGLFSIYEGYHKLLHPEPLSQVWVAIVVLVFAILLEGGSLFGAIREKFFMFHGRPFREWLADFCKHAEMIMSVGTCAAFGGVVTGHENINEMSGLQFLHNQKGGLLGSEFVSKNGLPVVNVPGCPSHPDWIVETMTALLKG